MTPIPGDPARAPAVAAMFARVAPRYDRANRLMSFGIDRRWRRRAITALGDTASGDVLDNTQCDLPSGRGAILVCPRCETRKLGLPSLQEK